MQWTSHESTYSLLPSVQVFDSHMTDLYIVAVLVKPLIRFSANGK